MFNRSLDAAEEEYGPEGRETQKQLWPAANGRQKGYRKGAMGGISANAQRLDYDGWNTDVEIQGDLWSVDDYRTTDYRLTDNTLSDWGADAQNVYDAIKMLQNKLNGQGDNSNKGWNPQQEGVWLY